MTCRLTTRWRLHISCPARLPHSIAQHLLAAVRSPYMHTYQQMPASWGLGFVSDSRACCSNPFRLSARRLAAICSRCRCTCISSAAQSVVRTCTRIYVHQRVFRIRRCRCSSSSISAKSGPSPVLPCRHQTEESSVKMWSTRMQTTAIKFPQSGA